LCALLRRMTSLHTKDMSHVCEVKSFVHCTLRPPNKQNPILVSLVRNKLKHIEALSLSEAFETVFDWKLEHVSEKREECVEASMMQQPHFYGMRYLRILEIQIHESRDLQVLNASPFSCKLSIFVCNLKDDTFLGLLKHRELRLLHVKTQNRIDDGMYFEPRLLVPFVRQNPLIDDLCVHYTHASQKEKSSLTVLGHFRCTGADPTER